MYVFTQPLCNEQDVTKGQFSNGVLQARIQNFPSSRMVVLPMLNHQNLPYYLPLVGERNHGPIHFQKEFLRREI